MDARTFDDIIDELHQVRREEVTPTFKEYSNYLSDLDLNSNSTEMLINKLERFFGGIMRFIRKGYYDVTVVESWVAALMNHLEIAYIYARSAYPYGVRYFTTTLGNDRKKVAKGKRRDYTRESADVLQNFKNQAEYHDLRSERCLAVHMEKQYSAIVTYLKTDGDSESEPIIKRVGDCLNYLELYYAIVVEKNQEASPII